MNDKEYYARLRRDMEKNKADRPVKPVKKSARRKSANVIVGKPMAPDINSNTPITGDDILNVRIAAETSDDVLDFIRRI